MAVDEAGVVIVSLATLRNRARGSGSKTGCLIAPVPSGRSLQRAHCCCRSRRPGVVCTSEGEMRVKVVGMANSQTIAYTSDSHGQVGYSIEITLHNVG